MSETRLTYLDGLRGIAILMVILIHTRLFGEPTSGIVKEIINNGDKGVQLFFIISGLTLALSSEKFNLSVFEFYKKRIVRIWPLFASFTIFYAVLNSHGILSTATTLLLLHGLSPTLINLVVPGGWYIGTLVIFYLIFPILWRLIRSGTAASLFFIGSAGLAIGLKKILWFLPGEYLYYYAPAQLPIFILGFVAYFAIKEKKVSRIWLLLVPTMITLDILRSTIVPDYLWWGLLWAGVIIGAHKRKYWLFENKVIQSIGKVSYEMYLVHFATYYLVVQLGIAQLSGSANTDAILRWGMAVVGSYGVIKIIRVLGFR